MPTTILLVDDHELVRAGLRSVLQQDRDVTVVAEASDGRTAVRLARELAPDVIIIDINLPELNGIEATRQIVQESSRSKVIALSLHGDRRVVDQMLQSGASAYLMKNSAAVELSIAIKAVMRGETYLSSRVAQVVVTTYLRRKREENGGAFVDLTPKEREVLQLLSEGKTNKEVASRLDISPKTVESHRAAIMDKLDIRTVAELTKYAVREGLTSLDG